MPAITSLSDDTLTTQINPNANAGVSLSHAGTSDLSFTMHWWTTGAGLGQPGCVSYAPTIYVQGPAGLPYH